MDREWEWDNLILLGMWLFLLWCVWIALSRASGFACSSEIRRALDDSSQMIVAGLVRSVSPTEQEASFRKWLVPDICSVKQFEESFERERKGAE